MTFKDWFDAILLNKYDNSSITVQDLTHNTTELIPVNEIPARMNERMSYEVATCGIDWYTRTLVAKIVRGLPT